MIPLFMNETEENLDLKLQQVNGVILPGGSGDYYRNGEYIFKKLKQLNENNIVFPLWGICLGLEHMVKYVSQNSDILSVIEVINRSLPIQFT